MGITTSSSIGVAKPLTCAKCGHEGGLMRLNANRERIHFDDCPAGPPPAPEEPLIAQDPLSDKNGTTVAALERLAKLGHGLKRSRQRVGIGADSHHKIAPSEVRELDFEAIRKAQEEAARSLIAIPPPVGQEEEIEGHSGRPLRASKRGKTRE
jgi:hypothetical protein